MRTTSLNKKCRYCNELYHEKDSEHVFPKGLGGQDLYMDCVCEKCNNYFSGLERELYQKSIIALMRSTEGIVGYKASDKPAPFKAPILLTFDKENKIVYEVGQFHKMQVFIRPQIIQIKEEYYIEGDTDEGVKKFVEKFKSWMQTNLKIVTTYPKGVEDTTGFVKFKKEIQGFSSNETEEKIKIKDEIILDLLPETHELFKFLNPRIFIDDDKKLRIRARTVQEAVNFIIGFLNFTLEPRKLTSFTNGIHEHPVVYVGLSFNNLKSEQALVKIGLNCLMHYFTQIKDDEALDICIEFIRKGSPSIRSEVAQKNSIIDRNDGTHNVFFCQVNNSVNIRISLFNGGFVYSFYIPDLKILQPYEYNRLIVDYKTRIHKFENQADFFKSFT
jgi:hypothetical protein